MKLNIFFKKLNELFENPTNIIKKLQVKKK